MESRDSGYGRSGFRSRQSVKHSSNGTSHKNHNQSPSSSGSGSGGSSADNLKRSKSMHCSKSNQQQQQQNARNPHHSNNKPVPIQYQNGAGNGVGNGSLEKSSSKSTGTRPYYTSRRHHSIQEFGQPMLYIQQHFNKHNGQPSPPIITENQLYNQGAHGNGFMLNSSSHNLYYQFQASSLANQPRGSCSSGNSLASLTDSQQQKPLKTPNDHYYEDSVFYENTGNQQQSNPLTHSQSHSLCNRMGSMTLSGWSDQTQNGQHHHSLQQQRQQAQLHAQQQQQLYTKRGSNSSTSLYNGNSDLNLLIDAFDFADTLGPDYQGDPDDNVWEDIDRANNGYESANNGGSGKLAKDKSGSSLNDRSDNYSSSSLIASGQTKRTKTSPASSSSSISAASNLVSSYFKRSNGLSMVYRFYILKQKNYPPLYLDNGSNRRRIYRILVLGYPSSGKTTLIEQFGNSYQNGANNNINSDQLSQLTSCGQQSANSNNSTLAMSPMSFNPANQDELNNPKNLLIHFLESDSFDKYLLQVPITDYQPDVYLVLYNINNRDSFNSVKKTLVDLQRWDDIETKSIIIVANKSDLVRGRCVTRREGRDLASNNSCKYIETSCTISHNIDALLQGIGSQICLKEKQQMKYNVKEQELNQSSTVDYPAQFNPKIKRKSSFFKRILRKTALNKSKSCDNLHVL